MVELEHGKLFHLVPASELEALRSCVELRSCEAGEVLFKEGDAGTGIYQVRSGRVQISAFVSATERRVLTMVEPGDFFGEMAVVDREPRSATASAEVPSTIFFIPQEPLVQHLKRSPTLAFGLMREFSLRMRDFNRHYIQEVLQAERLVLVGRFARSIVHDFKNPLNVIGLAADLVASDAASPELRRSSQQRIRKQVDRMGNMINELLEFTRGSQGSSVLVRTDYHVYVKQLLEELQEELAQKPVRLEAENLPPHCQLLLHPHRLSRVFFNLVNNAVDAMPDGGVIRIRFVPSEREIITEIEDSGRGVAPEVAQRLFQPFATYGKAHGTGLGLSIAKRIVEDHRGTIGYRGEPGHGAVFLFTLPLNP